MENYVEFVIKNISYEINIPMFITLIILKCNHLLKNVMEIEFD